MRIFLPILSLLCLFALSCKSQQSAGMDDKNSASNFTEFPANSESLSFETVSQGNYSGVNEASNQLIQSAEAWRQLWEQVGSNQMPPPALPQVDFSQSVLIACFMGDRNSGGHSLGIKEIRQDGTTAYVSYIELSPGQNCFVTDAITQPFHIVRISQGKLKSASFQANAQVKNCGE